LLAALAASAHAVVLYSPPMTPGDGNALQCQVILPGSKATTFRASACTTVGDVPTACVEAR
jgi:hypothetical protein